MPPSGRQTRGGFLYLCQNSGRGAFRQPFYYVSFILDDSSIAISASTAVIAAASFSYTSALEVETLGALFEAGALAANVQVAAFATERLTLEWFRQSGGDRVA